MPIFITQGRYTQSAIAGMVKKPEDRSRSAAALFKKAGGRLIGSWLTFGEYDFLVIADVPSVEVMASVVLAAAAGGSLSDLKTVPALDWAAAKNAFAEAGPLAGSFKSAGTR